MVNKTQQFLEEKREVMKNGEVIKNTAAANGEVKGSLNGHSRLLSWNWPVSILSPDKTKKLELCEECFQPQWVELNVESIICENCWDEHELSGENF